MKQKNYQHTLESLSKLMSYILCHRPDEFGLFLDEDGFVSLKEFHQAIVEENGWSFVRKSHLMDIINYADRQRFELREGKIKAIYGHSLPAKLNYVPVAPPKLLYHAATRKSYPHILEKGLSPVNRQYVHLTLNKELALRTGKRRDNKPVLLEIMAQRASREGIKFYCLKQLIYFAETIPPSYIAGPPLHKVQVKSFPKAVPAQPVSSFSQPTPGSFTLTADMLGLPKDKVRRGERHARKRKMGKKR